ncbi:MAG: prepilin-type N-terminal cleavage/methylation domain-containing protein [Candidatus Staskawiczbacteria bacterium]|jgi:prepilin-type N-terminal cleavage/methylation domain-containing protein
MSKSFLKEQNKGFTILEMVVAIFILVVAILGTYSIFSRMAMVTSTASAKLTAAYLAQEGIEIVRNIRDTNWLDGSVAWDNGIINCASGCEADYTTNSGVGGATPLKSWIIPGEFLYIDEDGFYRYNGITPTGFTRKITVTEVPGHEDEVLNVEVEVSWDDRGTGYSFVAETDLYNWR